MTKRHTLPPYDKRSSTETNNTLVPLSSLSDVKAVHPTTPNPPREAHPQQEIEWKTSLKNLEHQMILYQDHAKGGGASEQDAEQVAKAMDIVADSHTDPKVKIQWRERAEKFRKADPKERDGILQGILKGFLILLTSPFYLVGATLHTAGAILDGLGLILKGAGQLTKKLVYTGGSFTSAKTTPNTQ